MRDENSFEIPECELNCVKIDTLEEGLKDNIRIELLI